MQRSVLLQENIPSHVEGITNITDAVKQISNEKLSYMI